MIYSKSLYSAIYLAAILMLIAGCGSKRNPTGGPEDTIKPTVVSCSPAEFGEISNGQIEISFSKNMDKASLANSIYIYPPVQNKKVSLDRSTIKIKLNEPLLPQTNYFVTLSTRLKDIRNNPLAQNQTLVFRSGELNKYRIAGTITYEDNADNGLPVELSLFSPDSLLVLSDRISGGAYAIDALNPQVHILRSYIDKNQNGRYDFGLDPFFEGVSDGKQLANMNINLAYADSVKPSIRNINSLSNRELLITLSEPLKSYQSVTIMGKQPVQIYYHLLEDNRISILCVALESMEYTLQLRGAEDLKGNTVNILESKFKGKAEADTLAPKVVWTNPRNGSSVNSLSPVLELHFSELIPMGKIHAQLFAGKEEIPLKQLSSTSRIQRFQPLRELVNYRSHTLKILSTTTDFSGNSLEDDYELQFLPLKRQ